MRSDDVRNLDWSRPSSGVPATARFLPEPERRARDRPIVSVDDLVEPPDIFDGRIPAKWQDRAPRIVEHDDGSEAWLFEGNVNTSIG